MSLKLIRSLSKLCMEDVRMAILLKTIAPPTPPFFLVIAIPEIVTHYLHKIKGNLTRFKWNLCEMRPKEPSQTAFYVVRREDRLCTT